MSAKMVASMNPAQQNIQCVDTFGAVCAGLIFAIVRVIVAVNKNNTGSQLMENKRLIALAAGVVQEFSPEIVVYAAAEAGFNAVGIWYDPDSWNDKRSVAVAQALKETGLCALDMEVLWMRPGESLDHHDQLVDAARELGARNLLCVSTEPETAQTKRRFEHICRRAEGSSLRIVLEFLPFMEIKSLAGALEVVSEVAHPAGGILVDTLHLQRTGSTPQDLTAIDPHLMPYIQLCDARGEPEDPSIEGLLEDALYLRLLPGEGGLPLLAVLEQLDPLLPLSLEVRSRALMEQYPTSPVDRAVAVYQATRRFLESVPAG
ncbi:MAG: TIM barrel protein [Halioglobus sp.]